jgi:hypothetical protein
MQEIQGRWASRFIWASIIQGLIAVVATVLIAEPLTFVGITWYCPPAKVSAGGGGGTWMFPGYVLYLVVGVVAVAVTAIFYSYIEGTLGKVYNGLTNYLAWGHLILMNVGVTGSMLLMMYGGYLAGWSGAATTSGGLGYTGYQIHIHYLSHFQDPIGALVMVAALGAILGGLGFILRMRMK